MIDILKCRNCGYIGQWKECCEHMSFDEPTANEAWAAALAAPRQPGEMGAGVPEGWKLVPVEPTEKMVEAAVVRRPDFSDINTGRKSYPNVETRQAYRAMLAAAPVAPTEGASDAASAQQDQMTRERIMQIVRYSTVGSKAVPESEWVAFARAIEHELRAAQQVQADAGVVASTGDAHVHAMLKRFKNPMTPYGVLLRALRVVAGATLMDMADYLGVKPSDISAMEFGRRKVTYQDAVNASAFFNHRGINVTLHALEFARDRAAMSREQGEDK